jgi:hypothetical protein
MAHWAQGGLQAAKQIDVSAYKKELFVRNGSDTNGNGKIDNEETKSWTIFHKAPAHMGANTSVDSGRALDWNAFIGKYYDVLKERFAPKVNDPEKAKKLIIKGMEKRDKLVITKEERNKAEAKAAKLAAQEASKAHKAPKITAKLAVEKPEAPKVVEKPAAEKPEVPITNFRDVVLDIDRRKKEGLPVDMDRYAKVLSDPKKQKKDASNHFGHLEKRQELEKEGARHADVSKNVPTVAQETAKERKAMIAQSQKLLESGEYPGLVLKRDYSYDCKEKFDVGKGETQVAYKAINKGTGRVDQDETARYGAMFENGCVVKEARLGFETREQEKAKYAANQNAKEKAAKIAKIEPPKAAPVEIAEAKAKHHAPMAVKSEPAKAPAKDNPNVLVSCTKDYTTKDGQAYIKYNYSADASPDVSDEEVKAAVNAYKQKGLGVCTVK